jgi:cytoskeletal protein CcmA (bactofilin family)
MSTEPVVDRRTIVEEGTTFKGKLESSCPVLVSGRIEGDLAAPSLSVSATGAVQGKVHVASLQSEGELCGEFEADRVQLAGVVRDHTVIRAQTLEIKLASQCGKMQVVFGQAQEASAVESAKGLATRVEPRPSRPLALRPSQPPPS